MHVAYSLRISTSSEHISSPLIRTFHVNETPVEVISTLKFILRYTVPFEFVHSGNWSNGGLTRNLMVLSNFTASVFLEGASNSLL